MTSGLLQNRTHYALSTDAVVFAPYEDILKILLIKRKNPPFKGKWALPGGFIEENETLEEGVKRELEEETGLKDTFLKQFFTFSEVNRDPRGRVISTAYWALIPPTSSGLTPVPSSDASEAKWQKMNKLPPLAFDHEDILKLAYKVLKQEISYHPYIFNVLLPKFTLGQVQKIYETIKGEKLDKRNLRKKFFKMNFFKETGEYEQGKKGPLAQLYAFDWGAYKKRPDDFEIII